MKKIVFRSTARGGFHFTERLCRLALVVGVGLASLPVLADEARPPRHEPQSQTDAPAGTPPGGEAPPPVSQDSTLVLRSADGSASLRFGLRLFADVRADTWDANQPLRTTFFIRRARLQLDANVFRWVEARLLVDPDAAGSRIADAWLALRPVPWLRLQLGRLQLPFGYEWNSTSEKYLDFIERSLLFSALGLGYDTGVLLNGTAGGERLSWWVGAVNGNGGGSSNGTDKSRRKDLAARVSVSPLRGLSLGASGTSGWQSPREGRGMVLETGRELFTRPPVEGLRWRLGVEAILLAGPASLKAEYGHMAEGRGSLSPLETDAFYVSATWCFTGESKTDKGVVPVRPLRPFAADSGPGAWELAARYGRLGISSRDPWSSRSEDIGSVTAQELTLGLNWYFSSSTRFSLNAIRYDIRHGTRTGAYELLARLMLFF